MDWLEYLGFRWLTSRIFRFRPRIYREGNVLIARSGWRAQFCSLGFGSRQVTVDPAAKVLRLNIRRFWLFFTARRVEFDWIQEILYEYGDLGIGFWAYQQMDLFTVRLRLKSGEVVTLFRFFGEGDFVNNTGWPDWFYWGDILEADMTKGNQERESLVFCDLLSRMIGVPITNPAP